MLSQNYSNGSIVSVDMDVVGVMAAYLPVARVCSALSREALSGLCSTLTQHGQICCLNTDYVHDRTITVILTKLCVKFPPKYVGIILNIFKCFIVILIVSTNYIFVHLLDIKVFQSSLMHGTNMKIVQE